MYELLHITLLVAAIIFALLSIEAKRLHRAAMAFCIFSVILGIIFYMLAAPYVAVAQLVIYAGAVTVLLLVVISLTRGGWEE
ncbi:MAG: NADH-quinone oxidoreductase subunit J [Candidatus Baldrarchaeia archaeon]